MRFLALLPSISLSFSHYSVWSLASFSFCMKWLNKSEKLNCLMFETNSLQNSFVLHFIVMIWHVLSVLLLYFHLFRRLEETFSRCQNNVAKIVQLFFSLSAFCDFNFENCCIRRWFTTQFLAHCRMCNRMEANVDGCLISTIDNYPNGSLTSLSIRWVRLVWRCCGLQFHWLAEVEMVKAFHYFWIR